MPRSRGKPRRHSRSSRCKSPSKNALHLSKFRSSLVEPNLSCLEAIFGSGSIDLGSPQDRKLMWENIESVALSLIGHDSEETSSQTPEEVQRDVRKVRSSSLGEESQDDATQVHSNCTSAGQHCNSSLNEQKRSQEVHKFGPGTGDSDCQRKHDASGCRPVIETKEVEELCRLQKRHRSKRHAKRSKTVHGHTRESNHSSHKSRPFPEGKRPKANAVGKGEPLLHSCQELCHAMESPGNLGVNGIENQDTMGALVPLYDAQSCVMTLREVQDLWKEHRRPSTTGKCDHHDGKQLVPLEEVQSCLMTVRQIEELWRLHCPGQQSSIEARDNTAQNEEPDEIEQSMDGSRTSSTCTGQEADAHEVPRRFPRKLFAKEHFAKEQGCYNEAAKTTMTTVRVERPYPEPKIQEPTVQEPTVQEPTVQEPTVQEPTVQEPTAVQESALQEATIREASTVQEATIRESTIRERTVRQSTVKGRTVQESTVQETEETAVLETAVQETTNQETKETAVHETKETAVQETQETRVQETEESCSPHETRETEERTVQASTVQETGVRATSSRSTANKCSHDGRKLLVPLNEVQRCLMSVHQIRELWRVHCPQKRPSSNDGNAGPEIEEPDEAQESTDGGSCQISTFGTEPDVLEASDRSPRTLWEAEEHFSNEQAICRYDEEEANRAQVSGEEGQTATPQQPVRGGAAAVQEIALSTRETASADNTTLRRTTAAQEEDAAARLEAATPFQDGASFADEDQDEEDSIDSMAYTSNQASTCAKVQGMLDLLNDTREMLENIKKAQRSRKTTTSRRNNVLPHHRRCQKVTSTTATNRKSKTTMTVRVRDCSSRKYTRAKESFCPNLQGTLPCEVRTITEKRTEGERGTTSSLSSNHHHPYPASPVFAEDTGGRKEGKEEERFGPSYGKKKTWAHRPGYSVGGGTPKPEERISYTKAMKEWARRHNNNNQESSTMMTGNFAGIRPFTDHCTGGNVIPHHARSCLLPPPAPNHHRAWTCSPEERCRDRIPRAPPRR